jgi:D-threo-aldose 1-dehydrogenase
MPTILEKRPLGRSGVLVTTLGFGGGPLGHLDTPDATAITRQTVDTAWERGIRYFDTAPLYGLGRSESRLGAALAARNRDEFVLSSKVGRLLRRPAAADPGTRDLEVVFDYSQEGAVASFEESLERLKLGRVDVLLIHDIDRWTHADRQPRAFSAALDGAYRTLADLKARGLVRAIGLGVNEWQVCRDFAERVPIDCVLLAGRFTLLEQEAGREFLPFCVERGLSAIVGGPFNSGILATGAVEGALYNYAPAPPDVLDRVRRIEAVVGGSGVPLAAAALAFPLRHPAVAAVIPGMMNPSEVEAAAASLQRPIPEEVWLALSDRGDRARHRDDWLAG